MARAIDVASYIATRKHLSGEVQLQKLLYYAQAWALVWDGQPLFTEHVEAWTMGPVVPAIRHVPTILGRPDTLTETQQATVDAVLEFYGDKFGTQLIALTHSEAPWREVWGDRPSGARCTDEISHNSMRRFYTKKALAGEGPVRRATARSVVNDGELLAIAEANKQIWSETLEILAR